ncbi:MAG TPA: hypothetical protein V6C81_21315 [Planktothrix sp.]|jgi:hypothetical protein
MTQTMVLENLERIDNAGPDEPLVGGFSLNQLSSIADIPSELMRGRIRAHFQSGWNGDRSIDDTRVLSSLFTNLLQSHVGGLSPAASIRAKSGGFSSATAAKKK